MEWEARPGRGPRRTKNLVHQLSVSLEDMYNGTVRKLALQKNVICDGCDGVGGKAGAVQKCPACRGTGMQVRIQQLGPGMMQQIQSMCQECHGEGERVDPKLRCKKCNGRGRTEVSHLPRYRDAGEDPAAGARHDAADPVHVSGVSRRGREGRPQAPL